jgi:nucleoside-diphosphate-sugar epimerase
VSTSNNGRVAFVTGASGFLGRALVRRLLDEGWHVRGLVRSDGAAIELGRAGAEPIIGDLGEPETLRAGAAGCTVAFHAAARVGEWGRWEEFEAVNVKGTQNALDACRAAGVARFVHVGSEAAVLAGTPLVGIDETAPLRPDSKAPYCASKALAERAVRAATSSHFETVVVRPRMVWGPGDPMILPGLVKTVRTGRFAWLGGGHQRISTTHVENAVEGLLLAAERGRPGESYFVTDGEPVVFREFVTRLLATQGLEPPDRTMPVRAASLAGAGMETAWRTLRLKGEPPLNRMAVWFCSLECTLDISKARTELGYRPIVSIEEGLGGLRERERVLVHD